MKDLRFVLPALLLLLCSGCGNAPGTAQPVPSSAGADAAPLVELPEPPAMLASEAARRMFVAAHYWQGLRWDDTTAVASGMLQAAFHDWAALLYALPETGAASVAHHLISDGAGHPSMQLALYEAAASLMNDPNSPYRNEELFLPVLQALVSDTVIDETSKVRPRYLLSQLGRNRKGAPAADLTLTLREGREVSLRQWRRADFTLLYFFNPDCHDCERVGGLLRSDRLVQALCADGRLQVAAVYPDADLTAWDAHAADVYPDGWLVGRLAAEAERGKYYLPAIPNLYLLDREGRVLLKDAPVERILSYLASVQE